MLFWGKRQRKGLRFERWEEMGREKNEEKGVKALNREREREREESGLT